MDYMVEIFGIGSIIIAFILVGRFNMGLLFNYNEMTKVIAALGVMVVGALIGKTMFATIVSDSSDLGFNCNSMGSIDFFYDCGGWPIVGDGAKIFVEKIFSVITNVLVISPAFASIVGAIYIQRQLVSNWEFDWLDVGRVFFAGFTLMITILLIPKISTSLSEILLNAGNYSSLVKEGKDNLASLITLIRTASEEAERTDLDIWTDLRIIALRIGVFSLSSIINYVGPCFILIQALIFLSAPVAMLSAVFTDREAWTKGFEIALKYANFIFVQIIYWTMFTLAPSVGDPSKLQSLDYPLAFKALGLGAIILIISVVLLIVTAKFIAIPLIMMTIRRLT
jgi:hypothetical protein